MVPTLRDHRFLVGISSTGHGRSTTPTGSTSGASQRSRGCCGLDRLKAHEVDWNILCTVHAANEDHPLEVYRFFRDESVRATSSSSRSSSATPELLPGGDRHRPLSRPRSSGAASSTAMFDEWVRRDVGTVYVCCSTRRSPPGSGPPALCIFAETCGNALALEHNGDLYACDHFVEPKTCSATSKRSTWWTWLPPTAAGLRQRQA